MKLIFFDKRVKTNYVTAERSFDNLSRVALGLVFFFLRISQRESLILAKITKLVIQEEFVGDFLPEIVALRTASSRSFCRTLLSFDMN